MPGCAQEVETRLASCNAALRTATQRVEELTLHAQVRRESSLGAADEQDREAESKGLRAARHIALCLISIAWYLDGGTMGLIRKHSGVSRPQRSIRT